MQSTEAAPFRPRGDRRCEVTDLNTRQLVRPGVPCPTCNCNNVEAVRHDGGTTSDGDGRLIPGKPGVTACCPDCGDFDEMEMG